MPDFHAEPYIYLPALTHKSALSRGALSTFRVTTKGKWKLIDDVDLKYVHPPRKDSIGAKSAPYGPARVEVYDKAGVCVQAATTAATNHCWVTGLSPSTEYTYKVFVKGEEWARGERWDWSAEEKALVAAGNRYTNRFETFPDPNAPAASLTFGGHRRFRRGRQARQSGSAPTAGGRRPPARRGYRSRPPDHHDRRQHLRRQQASGHPDRRHRT